MVALDDEFSVVIVEEKVATTALRLALAQPSHAARSRAPTPATQRGGDTRPEAVATAEKEDFCATSLPHSLFHTK